MIWELDRGYQLHEYSIGVSSLQTVNYLVIATAELVIARCLIQSAQQLFLEAYFYATFSRQSLFDPPAWQLESVPNTKVITA